MKIAYNPKSGAALQTAPDNNDITFDLAGKIIYARGEGFKGTDTTYDIFRKASESVGGYNGLVPAPNYNSNSENRFLREDGTWCIPNAETLNGYSESSFFRYRGDINSAYVDLTNYEKNAENFASYNPGMYNILRNGYSELFINFAKNIGSTSSLELKTSYDNDDYLYIRKVIDNNRVSGAWRPLAFADNTVRSVTLNNNQLRINTNGINSDLIIPYATNTSNIISSEFKESNSYGLETGISWSLASSTNSGTFGTAIDSNGFAVNNNANGILWLGTHKTSTNGGYGGQLGISSNQNIYYRYISNGSFPSTWDKIVFERDLIALNIKLTGYQLDANNFENLTSNDTVSSALSKLECKAQFVYSWLTSDADDADEKINKWHEVEHFLEGIEETTLNSILNTKADKATTIQGYGLWEKYTDLNDAPMGAFFCGGTSVANSPESNNYISGITLAKDKNSQYRTQLGFVNHRVFTRQESGANNWSQWRELAFLGDVALKATTLAGYGITDAVTLNTGQTVTGLKTFESNSSGTGISLILKNKGWTGGMSTALDFYTGGSKTVPSARIEDYMISGGAGGGCLRFFTQSKSETNPNPNALVERMRIDDQGVVKIISELTSPKININGANSNAFISSDSSTNMYFNVNNRIIAIRGNDRTGSDTEGPALRPGSNFNDTFYLGTSAVRWANVYSVLGNFSGTVNAGSVTASGDITAYSDRRLKSNIQTLENRGYIEPVTFEKDGKKCIGFIAQDVEKKYPELVNSDGEYLSLNYQQYTAVLQAQIIELEKRIKQLENGIIKH